MGERLGGFIYGTIVALSVIVAGARAYPHGPGHVAVLVVVTSFVFWLAHVYSHALGESLARDRRLSVEELTYLARREASMLEAALRRSWHCSSRESACSPTRPRWGRVRGRARGARRPGDRLRAHRSGSARSRPSASVAANLALGVVLVALKLFVSH
jgi:hypothetical protein